MLVGATTSLVLIAFVVPLALLLRTVAADRAVQGATAEAQSLSSLVATSDRESLALAVQQLDATSPDAVTLFLADGATIGAPPRARRSSSWARSAPARPRRWTGAARSCSRCGTGRGPPG